MGKEMTLELELPWPPSVNHYYRHVGPRVLISRDGRKFRERVVARFRQDHTRGFAGPVELFIELYPPDNRRRDVDNSLKCTWTPSHMQDFTMTTVRSAS